MFLQQSLVRGPNVAGRAFDLRCRSSETLSLSCRPDAIRKGTESQHVQFRRRSLDLAPNPAASDAGGVNGWTSFALSSNAQVRSAQSVATQTRHRNRPKRPFDSHLARLAARGLAAAPSARARHLRAAGSGFLRRPRPVRSPTPYANSTAISGSPRCSRNIR